MATAENALIKREDLGGFNFPAIVDKEATLEILQTNMEGIDFQFERIKIPSGGMTVFEITDESGETKNVNELVGIILDHYPVNAYWSSEYSGQNNPPDCVAMDGKNGIARPESGLPGGVCSKCPLNQWGTDPQKDGTTGAGKACRNLHRVYLVLDGEIFPKLITCPPTSLKSLGIYMKSLSNKVKPHYAAITRVKPIKAQNKKGIAYTQISFTKMVDLAPAAALEVKKFVEGLKPAMRAQRIEAADYNVEEPAGETQSQDAPQQPSRSREPVKSDTPDPF